MNPLVLTALLSIGWDAAPDATSWKVFRGIELLATVTTPAATVACPRDQLSTFSVISINSTGSSAPASITVIPFTPKHSEDLKVWIARTDKTFFVESKPRQFASYSFPTP